MKSLIFNFRLLFILLLSTQIICVNGYSQNPIFKVAPDYLSKHDIVYQTPAYEGFEGFPLGNGDLGGMLWNTNNGIEVQLNKNDLFDQTHEENRATLRGGARLNIDFGAPAFEWTYLNKFNAQLSLKDALVNMKSSTPFMETNINSWVAINKNVWCFQISAKTYNQLKNGTKIRVSLERWGSRAFPGWYGYFSKDAKSGLGNTNSITDGKNIILEHAFQNLQFSIACRVLGEQSTPNVLSSNRAELISKGKSSNHNLTIIVSLVTSNESKNTTKSALSLLDEFEKQSLAKENELHQQWWTKFWNQSFVHLDNDYIENIYYLRRYLMASSSRGKYPVVFNGGLWTWNHDVRNWVTPHHFNTQQQYWGLFTQNDCELMLPYLNTYYNLIPKAEAFAKLRGADNAILWSEPHDFFGSMTFWDRADMINNFTPASQIAGLFWEYYQYTGDKKFLLNKAYPFMKMAASFYLQKLQWDSIKKEYFIYPSQPYENPRSNNLKNPITDRTAILSNFRNCISAATILSTDQHLVKEWKKRINHIWPIPYRNIDVNTEVIEHAWYPNDSIFPKLTERGPWIAHMSASTSAVFPGNLLGIDQVNTREYNAMVKMIQSHSPKINAISPEPIVAARLGMGNEVIKMMTEGIRRLQQFPQGLFYNIDHWYNLSIYKDSLKAPDISAQRDYIYDERAHYPNGLPAKPFIQCGLEPLSIYATSVNEMLLQSHEDKIRVFPAVPNNWATSFTLLARGGFLVSSEQKKNGTIPGVYIKSSKGNQCKLENPWPGKEIIVLTYSGKEINVNFKIVNKNIVVFNTDIDKGYLICPKSTKESLICTMYEGQKNQAPKRFFEASLGKLANY